MKKQINPSIKAHLLWSALILLSLIAVCAIPFALAQRNSGKRSRAASIAQLPTSQLPLVSSGTIAFRAITQPPEPAAPQVVLYDQYNNAGANATVSQDFEPANNAFDNQGADDFVVPAGQTWTINEVDVQGLYFNGPGPAASFNVFFYQD